MTHDSGSKSFDFKAMLRDERFWKIAFQVITLVVVFLLLSFFLGNLNRNLIQLGRAFGFGFLRNPAGFSIGESLIQYRPNDPYWRALMVGLGNTLTLVAAGIVLTTLLGTAAGIASFSKNWLVHKLSRAYVGLLGIAATIGAIVGAFYLWQWRTKIRIETGAGGQSQAIAMAVLALVWLAIIVFGMNWTVPEAVEGGGVTGGLRLSREYVAALTALVFYTSAFVAEIVRAGIQSLSKGQWEAARSLGLHAGIVMRLVVFPQALRVIIPPMNSEYMNLTKNTSLAFAIAFPEMYSVATTTYNQTGRPVEVFVVLMATYLILCLLITLVMNQFNRAVQFKER